MATFEAVEKCLIREWDNLVSAIRDSDSERFREAAYSNLASTMGYLLNFFQESDPHWRDFGADDLLDPEYEFPTPLRMTASGLMCWGDDDNYLSPFVGEFERDSETGELKDFVLYFAAAGPDGTTFTVPYTRDKDVRRRLFESRPRSPEDWAHVYRRTSIPTRETGKGIRH